MEEQEDEEGHHSGVVAELGCFWFGWILKSRG